VALGRDDVCGRSDLVAAPPGDEVSHLTRGPGTLAAALVDQPPGRDLDQPPAGTVRDTVGRPLLRRGEQRLLDRVLARRGVAVATDQRPEDVRRLVPPYVLERCGHSSAPPSPMTGRSSMVSPGPANCAAICSARAALSTSSRKNPAR